MEIDYLICILDNNAASFCHYDSPNYPSSEPAWMPIDMLQKAVAYAASNQKAINFIYGKYTPPKEYEELISTVAHVKIVPLQLASVYPEAILIVNADEDVTADTLEPESDRVIILRVKKSCMPGLGALIRSLWGRFKRINISLLDIANYTDTDFDEYKRQIEDVSDFVLERYRSSDAAELSFLSDRLLLNQMNNCDAGTKHLTLAPNGSLYLCPGFYYDNAEAVGTLETGVEIKNAHLLNLQYAPICRECDAYHCKRCHYLNKKLTLEVNTPSAQQCILSHLERNASRKVLLELETYADTGSFSSISKIDYLDPFTVLDRRNRGRGESNKPAKAKRLEEMDNRELLLRIYEMQSEILNLLKQERDH